jgi:hypothetical protein
MSKYFKRLLLFDDDLEGLDDVDEMGVVQRETPARTIYRAPVEDSIFDDLYALYAYPLTADKRWQLGPVMLYLLVAYLVCKAIYILFWRIKSHESLKAARETQYARNLRLYDFQKQLKNVD